MSVQISLHETAWGACFVHLSGAEFAAVGAVDVASAAARLTTLLTGQAGDVDVANFNAAGAELKATIKGAAYTAVLHHAGATSQTMNTAIASMLSGAATPTAQPTQDKTMPVTITADKPEARELQLTVSGAEYDALSAAAARLSMPADQALAALIGNTQGGTASTGDTAAPASADGLTARERWAKIEQRQSSGRTRGQGRHLTTRTERKRGQPATDQQQPAAASGRSTAIWQRVTQRAGRQRPAVQARNPRHIVARQPGCGSPVKNRKVLSGDFC